MNQENKELLKSFSFSVTRGVDFSVEADEDGQNVFIDNADKSLVEQEIRDEIKYHFQYFFEDKETITEKEAMLKANEVLSNLNIEIQVDNLEPELHERDVFNSVNGHGTVPDGVSYSEEIKINVQLKDIMSDLKFSNKDVDLIFDSFKENTSFVSNDGNTDFSKNVELVNSQELNLSSSKNTNSTKRKFKV